MTRPPEPNQPNEPPHGPPSGPPPGQQPGQPPGQYSGQPPGQYGGQPPGQYGGHAPGQYGGQPPGQFGGQYGGQPQGPPPGGAGQPYASYPSAPQYAQAPQVDQRGYVLDYGSGLYLPPGTELASVGRRIGAFFLGFLLTIVTLGIGWIIWGLIVWGRGTTPALQVLGMRCWRPMENEVPTWGTMALRQIVGRFIAESIIGIVGIVSFIIFCVHSKRQTLHDMIAGTVVLYDPNKVLDSPKR